MDVTRLRSLHGHTAAVNAARYTTDGSYCMTASDDRSVRLWNPHKDDPSTEGNALLIKTYAGVHGYQIFDVAISEDKTKFATAGGDRTSFLWDVASGRVIRRLTGHSQRVNTCHMNESGSLLYTGSYDKTLCIWDLKSNMREPIQILSDFRDSVTSVTTTRNEIIASSVDGTVRSYDLRMGQLHTDSLGLPITHTQLSPDKKSLSAACLGGDLKLVDLGCGKVLQQYKGRLHNSFKLESSFCHDAQHLCGASEDGSIRFWNMLTGRMLPVYLSLGSFGEDSNTSANAKLSASHNSEDQSGVSVPRLHRAPVYSVSCSPTQNTLVTTSSDGTAACWSYRLAKPTDFTKH
jgi:mitogen-activated protein kinase organizer 1